jgi:hypothetical protein
MYCLVLLFVYSVIQNTDCRSFGKRSIQNKPNQEELGKQMDAEIAGYHEIKKRIQFLEAHLKQHADFNLIDTKDLLAAASTLQSLKRTIIQPLETQLLAVKTQIKKENHNLSEDEMKLVKSVLEEADNFLKNSDERIQQLELIERDWESEEESEKIRQATENSGKKEQKSTGGAGTAEEKDAVQNVPTLIRSKKLLRLKEMIFNKDKVANAKMVTGTTEQPKTKSSTRKINLKDVKQQLDHERQEDAAPGLGKKKLQEALEEAKQKSHQYVDEHHLHEDHKDHQDHRPENNYSSLQGNSAGPSWLLVFSLASVSGILIVCLMLLIYSNKTQNIMKGGVVGGKQGIAGTYCELNEVRDYESALTTSNLTSSQVWADNWGSWDVKESQKFKLNNNDEYDFIIRLLSLHVI